MVEFQPILEAAQSRAGGEAALTQRLPAPKSVPALRAFGDDRYLSQMSLRIFRAGLRHSMVDGKWPAFEEVFHGSEPPVPTKSPGVLLARPRVSSLDDLSAAIEELAGACRDGDGQLIQNLLHALVPEYHVENGADAKAAAS